MIDLVCGFDIFLISKSSDFISVFESCTLSLDITKAPTVRFRNGTRMTDPAGAVIGLQYESISTPTPRAMGMALIRNTYPVYALLNNKKGPSRFRETGLTNNQVLHKLGDWRRKFLQLNCNYSSLHCLVTGENDGI